MKFKIQKKKFSKIENNIYFIFNIQKELGIPGLMTHLPEINN